MPIKTTILATEPVLVQQHELIVTLDAKADANTSKSISASSRPEMSARILTYGATLTHLICPDQHGKAQDIVLGFDDWKEYLTQAHSRALNPYFGSTIGRTASRVAHGSFTLANKYAVDHPMPKEQVPLDACIDYPDSSDPNHADKHTLQISNGLDCHHGGPIGFDKKHWSTIETGAGLEDGDLSNASGLAQRRGPFVRLQLISCHGDNGYPGRLKSIVEYHLDPRGELCVNFEASLVADETKCGEILLNRERLETDLHSTIVSMTNHTYWNLDGVLNLPDDSGSPLHVLEHTQTTRDAEETNEYVRRDAKFQDQEVTIVNNSCTIRNHLLWLRDSKIIELGKVHPIPTGRILDLPSMRAKDHYPPNHDTGSMGESLESLLNFSTASDMTSQQVHSSGPRSPFGKLLGPGLDLIPGGYGYDHVYALDRPTSAGTSSNAATNVAKDMKVGIQGYYPETPHVAMLFSPRSGIRLDVFTSEPAIVLYAAGYVDGSKLGSTKSKLVGGSSPSKQQQSSQQRAIKLEASFDKFSGLCLEPVRYPDAIHHPSWASMVTLHYDQTYRQQTIYKLGAQ
ncbi:hypothetical protein BGW38_009499 [Lunasporangiospora selenospora]|uniref:Aldose 1-epimerase n=1 Tax=Lunasporangiospora selenospora TaxID=979761 RepID=A0A9P6FX30_9FUNG|nr:hypothetical protein BGW38_009499 [Lunasporangiospora selenospora]